MSFSKIRYGCIEDEIFETIITDGTGKRIGKWKCMKKDYPQVIKILNKKFGLGMNISTGVISERDLNWNA